MELHEKLGIKKQLLTQIQNIISKCNSVEKSLIFGSRARGNYKEICDIYSYFREKYFTKTTEYYY